MLMNAIMFLCAVLDIQILYTYFRGMFHQKKRNNLTYRGICRFYRNRNPAISCHAFCFGSVRSVTDHNTVRKQYFDNLGINISLWKFSALQYYRHFMLSGIQLYRRTCFRRTLYLFLIESASKHAGDRRSDPAFDLQVYPSASCSRNNVSMAAQRIIL